MMISTFFGSDKCSLGHLLSESEQRAQAMASALNWMHDNSMSPGDLDDASIASIQFGGPMIGGLQCERRKHKELSSTPSKRNPGGIIDSLITSVRTIGGTKIESFAPKNDVANTLDWLRTNNHDLATADAPLIVSAYSQASQNLGHPLSESEQRAQAMASALDWMRDNSMSPGDLDDASIASIC
jgi:hypothetical protein